MEGTTDDIASALGEERALKLNRFGADLMSSLEALARDIDRLVAEGRAATSSKREFVVWSKTRPENDALKNVSYKVYEGASALELVC